MQAVTAVERNIGIMARNNGARHAGLRGEAVERRVERISRTGVRCTAVSTADDPFHRLLGHFRRTERAR